MHELSLLENVLEIIEANAASQGFSRVSKVTLAIGKLSCVETEALRFAFDAVMKNSVAEHAELAITTVDGIGRCERCGQTVRLQTCYDPCPYCGSVRITISQGMDMKITDLMVS